MSVRLWPTLPKDYEQNGFVALERPVLDDPEGPYYVVAEINRRRATVDDDAGDTTPTIRVLHGEALLGDLSGEARELLRRAQLARCGKPVPRPEPQPPMFDGNGEHLGDEMPGGGDPVQRHIDRAAVLAGDMEPELDGDDPDQAGDGEAPGDSGRVPFLSAAGDE